MQRSIQMAPSILSSDYLNLQSEIQLLAECDEPPEWFHIDVMDGHFVPNLTIGPPIIRALKRITQVPLDVHVMIENPADQLDWYLDAGADVLTFHLEALKPGAGGYEKGTSATLFEVSEAEVERGLTLLQRIRSAGALAGLAFNPLTPTSLLKPFYHQLDLVLLMSVHPGFGGQSIIPNSLERLREIRGDIDASGSSVLIEIDGGIDPTTAPLVAEAGAEILVAGNAIYGQADPIAAMQAIRSAV